MKNEDAWHAIRVAVQKLPQRSYSDDKDGSEITPFEQAEWLRMDILAEIRRVIMGGQK